MSDLVTMMFWNVHGKNLTDAVGQLAHIEQADIVLIAENGANPADVQAQLQAKTGRQFHVSQKRMMDVFSTYASTEFDSLEEGDRFNGWRLTLGPGREIGVFAVHLLSKLHSEPADQRLAAQNALAALQNFEQRLGHKRTVALGDFNLDPFEEPMAGADGFHAVLDRMIALRTERTVQGKSYSFFYNPMWSLMGDCSIGPPGSYYYDKGKTLTHFWHMFDQVIIRPDLVPALVANKLRIVDRIGNDSLLRKNVPDKDTFSDHLPLVVSFSKSKVPA